jgi:hypothetical protein
MDAFSALTKGLGNLTLEQRREIYRDLRSALGVSESEPMLPLGAEELAAWSRRCAELLSEEFSQRPATRPAADRALLEAALLQYGLAPTDEYLDSQLQFGVGLLAAGMPGLYLHSVVNSAALRNAVRAAREVLPPASAALIEQRYPSVVLLRHSLMQEAALGASQLLAPPAQKA